jgi:nicotinate phosphoribosyltransferase
MGIGTHLTNDVGHKALNIVMKLTHADFGNGPVGLVKLSDDAGKETGEPSDIDLAKRVLGISSLSTVLGGEG